VLLQQASCVSNHKATSARDSPISLEALQERLIEKNLRSKSEIKSFIALILCRSKVIQLLVPRHAIPDLVSLIVLQCVINLRADEQNNVVCRDTKQHFISSVVQRLVLILVDLCRDDVASLHCHVIQT